MSDSVSKTKRKGPAAYLREVKAEMKKVVWPTFSQTVNNTYVVILTIVIVAIFLTICDAVFGTLIRGAIIGDFKQAFMQVLGLGD